eukprot:TRINITY_DN3545_c0_g1_i1.p1 TRINITY_DN3545_c0_g1~~TRINITY_DN3545_c0_g1_i1.p1  ORF type:complete len:1353 (+),score=300.46 TRINITY_DN3545_c0_g1_i1:149-4207(+)
MPGARATWLVVATAACATAGNVTNTDTAIFEERKLAQVNGGKCCYLCGDKSEEQCYGCWDEGADESFCSFSDGRCKDECHGSWRPSDAKTIEDPAQQTALFGGREHVLWELVDGSGQRGIRDGLPAIDAVGEYVYTLSLTLQYSNVSAGRVAKTDLWTQETAWVTNLTDSDGNTPVHMPADILLSGPYVHVVVKNFLVGPLLYTLSADTGDVLSKLYVSTYPTDYTLAAQFPYVYVLAASGNLTCYNGTDGSQVWTQVAGSDSSPVVVQDGVAYAAGIKNEQMHINRWSADTGENRGAQTLVVPAGMEVRMPSLAVHPSIVLFTKTYFAKAEKNTHYDKGQPTGSIYAVQLNGQEWGGGWYALDIAGALSPVALADDNGAVLAIFHSCVNPRSAFDVPPQWWRGCVTWAISLDSSKNDPAGAHSVRWRYTHPPDMAISAPRVVAGQVYFAGMTYYEGDDWPQCEFYETHFFPKCFYPERRIPHFEIPVITALRVSDGALMWEKPTNIDIPIADGGGDLDTPGLMWDKMLHTSASNQTRVAAERYPDLTDPATVVWQTEQYMRDHGVSPDKWGQAPWEAYAVTPDGMHLLYTAADASGTPSLKLLKLPEEPEAAGSWSTPLVGTCAGLFCIAAVVYMADRFCLEDPYVQVAEVEENELVASQDPSADVCEIGPGGVKKEPGGLDPSAKEYVPVELAGVAPVKDEADIDYNIIRQLGKGGFSSVFLVEHKGTKEQWSMKRVDCKHPKDLRLARREVHILSNLPPHPGMLSIKEAFPMDNALCIITRYYREGDLSRYVHTYPDEVIPERTVLSFSKQIAEVLQHLHRQNPPVVHRDLKPENVLIDDDREHLVVADFGLSRPVDKTYMHTHAGTMAFMAPEAFDGPYNTKVDLWSLGCVMYSMCLKRSRHCKVMCVHVGRRGFYTELAETISERGYSRLVVDLVRQMLQANKHARPDAEEVLFRLSSDFPCLTWESGMDTAEPSVNAIPNITATASLPTSVHVDMDASGGGSSPAAGVNVPGITPLEGPDDPPSPSAHSASGSRRKIASGSSSRATGSGGERSGLSGSGKGDRAAFAVPPSAAFLLNPAGAAPMLPLNLAKHATSMVMVEDESESDIDPAYRSNHSHNNTKPAATLPGLTAAPPAMQLLRAGLHAAAQDSSSSDMNSESDIDECYRDVRPAPPAPARAGRASGAAQSGDDSGDGVSNGYSGNSHSRSDEQSGGGVQRAAPGPQLGLIPPGAMAMMGMAKPPPPPAAPAPAPAAAVPPSVMGLLRGGAQHAVPLTSIPPAIPPSALGLLTSAGAAPTAVAEDGEDGPQTWKPPVDCDSASSGDDDDYGSSWSPPPPPPPQPQTIHDL